MSHTLAPSMIFFIEVDEIAWFIVLQSRFRVFRFVQYAKALIPILSTD